MAGRATYSSRAALLDKAQAAGVKPVLLTATMIYEDSGNELNRKLAPYNEFLRSLARDRKLPLADLNSQMQAAAREGLPANEYIEREMGKALDAITGKSRCGCTAVRFGTSRSAGPAGEGNGCYSAPMVWLRRKPMPKEMAATKVEMPAISRKLLRNGASLATLR